MRKAIMEFVYQRFEDNLIRYALLPIMAALVVSINIIALVYERATRSPRRRITAAEYQ